MRDVGAGDRLAFETLDELGKVFDLGVQDLDRHLLAHV